ncbi:hypothetical protein DPMN_153116 [Dreissena polymorpha]|uniref:Uncharacterized protein n=1 Tax=Dreissena polymorpha TaxID=45954 RepID=A0A9D4J4I0_DREPO|nr:hypothetical protein DPMN_153116 [Dreissena polymorpha]
MDRWKKESERHQSRIVSIYMLPFDRLIKCKTPMKDINKTNTKNVSHIRKTAPPPGGHETNVLTKFHADWINNVTGRVFTCFHYIHIEKTAPPPGGHVFSPILTIFELNSNVLTKFHEDWTIIVSSRVFTRETAPPTAGHVFQRTGTTFELNQHIIETNILTNSKLDQGDIVTNILIKFHEDRTRHVASRVFRKQMPILKANLSNQETNVLTKFHADWINNVTGRVFTCFHYIHIEKTAPPPGGHVFSPILTIFELNSNVLTKFHEDWTIIVSSRVFTF